MNILILPNAKIPLKFLSSLFYSTAQNLSSVKPTILPLFLQNNFTRWWPYVCVSEFMVNL